MDYPIPIPTRMRKGQLLERKDATHTEPDERDERRHPAPEAMASVNVKPDQIVIEVDAPRKRCVKRPVCAISVTVVAVLVGLLTWTIIDLYLALTHIKVQDAVVTLSPSNSSALHIGFIARAGINNSAWLLRMRPGARCSMLHRDKSGTLHKDIATLELSRQVEVSRDARIASEAVLRIAEPTYFRSAFVDIGQQTDDASVHVRCPKSRLGLRPSPPISPNPPTPTQANSISTHDPLSTLSAPRHAMSAPPFTRHRSRACSLPVHSRPRCMRALYASLLLSRVRLRSSLQMDGRPLRR